MSIVTFADHNGRYCVKRSRRNTSRSFIEIPWVLMKNRWQNSAADEGVDHVVGIRRAKALGIAVGPLAISAKTVRALFNPCGCRGDTESDRVDRRSHR